MGIKRGFGTSWVNLTTRLRCQGTVGGVLKASGTCFIGDLNLSSSLEENINIGGRIAFGVTKLTYLQDSIATMALVLAQS